MCLDEEIVIRPTSVTKGGEESNIRKARTSLSVLMRPASENDKIGKPFIYLGCYARGYDLT
jgi:hypothetical protein